MCVGFSNGYDDFPHKKQREALAALVPGSAISFDRVALFHFAIFLGWAHHKAGESSGQDAEPTPLLCHLSGDANTVPRASVRLEDFRDIAQKSTVRIYRCDCSAAKRAGVIRECLGRVGETGYNAVTNNCEHFVRQVISREHVSYQTVWTIVAPMVQVPRLITRGAKSMAFSSSLSSSSTSRVTLRRGYRSTMFVRHEKGRLLRLRRSLHTLARLFHPNPNGFSPPMSLGLIDPEHDLLVIRVSHGGLKVESVEVNPCCTREFTGSARFIEQEMHSCSSCGLAERHVICRPCLMRCHQLCQNNNNQQQQQQQQGEQQEQQQQQQQEKRQQKKKKKKQQQTRQQQQQEGQQTQQQQQQHQQQQQQQEGQQKQQQTQQQQQQQQQDGQQKQQQQQNPSARVIRGICGCAQCSESALGLFRPGRRASDRLGIVGLLEEQLARTIRELRSRSDNGQTQ